VVSTIGVIGIAGGAVLLWFCLKKPSADKDSSSIYKPLSAPGQDLAGFESID
jgi:hypothetical protein